MKWGFLANPHITDSDPLGVYASTMRLPLLVACALGGMLLLIISRGGIRNRKQRSITLTGLLILFWVGLTLFGFSYFSVPRSLWTISTFDLAKYFIGGASFAMMVFFLWPRGAKTMLIASGAALVGFNLYAFAHYDLRHPTPAIRLYCMSNGLGMGIAIASVASLQRRDKALEDRTT